MAFDSHLNETTTPRRLGRCRRHLEVVPAVAPEDMQLALDAGFSADEVRYMFALPDDVVVSLAPELTLPHERL